MTQSTSATSVQSDLGFLSGIFRPYRTTKIFRVADSCRFFWVEYCCWFFSAKFAAGRGFLIASLRQARSLLLKALVSHKPASFPFQWTVPVNFPRVTKTVSSVFMGPPMRHHCRCWTVSFCPFSLHIRIWRCA